MHYFHVEDSRGELVDLVPFCSDSCHRAFCAENGLDYQGWNGAQEAGEFPEFCGQCGVVAGGAECCSHQRNNVVVNRFQSEAGEKCACGNWLQLPARYLDYAKNRG